MGFHGRKRDALQVRMERRGGKLHRPGGGNAVQLLDAEGLVVGGLGDPRDPLPFLKGDRDLERLPSQDQEVAPLLKIGEETLPPRGRKSGSIGKDEQFAILRIEGIELGETVHGQGPHGRQGLLEAGKGQGGGIHRGKIGFLE
jgi:hypothetical protein